MQQTDAKLKFHQTICTNQNPSSWMRHKIIWILRSPNLCQTTIPSYNYQKKKQLHCGLCRPVGTQSKNQRELKDKDLDRTSELKKLWNMKVTVISVMIGALGTDPKCWVKGMEKMEISVKIGTIQTTAFIRSVIILRRVLET